jgi:hypothetical protein
MISGDILGEYVYSSKSSISSYQTLQYRNTVGPYLHNNIVGTSKLLLYHLLTYPCTNFITNVLNLLYNMFHVAEKY